MPIERASPVVVDGQGDLVLVVPVVVVRAGLRSSSWPVSVDAIGAALFRHRLAVIVGFFVFAIVAAVVLARLAPGVVVVGPASAAWAPSGVACILAFVARAWGEARVGAAVYGQAASIRRVARWKRDAYGSYARAFWRYPT